MINFNVPMYLIDDLDDLVKLKNVTRTSVLNLMIEDYLSFEHNRLNRDGRFKELLSTARSERKPRSKPEYLNRYLKPKPRPNPVELKDEYIPPNIPDISTNYVDDHDWEERFKL